MQPMELMMRMKMRVLTAVLLCTLVFMTGCGASSVELKLAPPEGASYRYQDTMTQELVMDIQGFEVTLNQTIDIVTDMHVLEVDQDGQVVVEVTYESMAMEMIAPFTGVIRFDTADETTTVPPEFQAVTNMVGRTVGLTLDSRGNLIDLTGFEELFDDMASGVPADQPELEGIFESMTTMYDSESATGGLTGLIGPLPEGAVAVGDSWNEVVTTEFAYPMTIEAAYTVISIQNGEITLDMEGEIAADLDDFMSEFDLGDASIELSGFLNGEIVLDIETGMMIRSTQEFSMTATAEIYAEELGGDATIIYNLIQTFQRSMVDVE